MPTCNPSFFSPGRCVPLLFLSRLLQLFPRSQKGNMPAVMSILAVQPHSVQLSVFSCCEGGRCPRFGSKWCSPHLPFCAIGACQRGKGFDSVRVKSFRALSLQARPAGGCLCLNNPFGTWLWLPRDSSGFSCRTGSTGAQCWCGGGALCVPGAISCCCRASPGAACLGCAG